MVTWLSLSQNEVSGLTAVYVILVGLLMPFILTSAHLLLSHLVVVWTCIIILGKMLYQLHVVPVMYTSLCDAVSYFDAVSVCGVVCVCGGVCCVTPQVCVTLCDTASVCSTV